jgi:alcohol dehydrogenase
VTDGRILGHEGIGVIEQVGTGVSEFHVGDKVIISCVTACLKCDFCKEACIPIAGTAAGFWATPSTELRLSTCASRMPMEVSTASRRRDEEAMVMLSDILPTGFECGVLNGQVKPGDTIAIVGAGPVGLAVLLTAQFYSPAAIFMIDLDDKRLAVAKQFGATTLINSTDGHAAHHVMELTEGAGVDVAIEAVGLPGHLRHLPGDCRGRRTHRERGRPRQTGGTAHGETLGPQYFDHHAAGGHGNHTNAAEGRALGQTAAAQARDSSLRDERHHEGV